MVMENPEKIKILVVDDESLVVEYFLHALSERGYDCKSAKDGVEGIGLVSKEQFDVIITDLRMPNMHGHRFITEVLDRPFPPLLIVVTAVSDDRIEKDLYLRGVVEVATKPVNIEVLEPKIKSLLNLKRKGDSLILNESAMVQTSKEISRVTSELQAQFQVITSNFEKTIEQLKEQEKNLEDRYLGSMRMLANLMEQAGVHQGSHVARVEHSAEVLGLSCGIEGADLHSLKAAALLHEIGTFGLPDRLRNQAPWDLSPDDRTVYERYPIIGATLLSQVPGFESIMEIVEFHAENYDGTGFPEGKVGSNIPLGSRIIHLADSLDTFLMFTGDDKPDFTKARQFLLDGKGSLFDPRLVLLAGEMIERLVPEPGLEDMVQIDLFPSDLYAGMILAEDLYDSTGVFLGRKGIRITEPMLPRLRKAAGTKKIKIYKE